MALKGVSCGKNFGGVYVYTFLLGKPVFRCEVLISGSVLQCQNRSFGFSAMIHSMDYYLGCFTKNISTNTPPKTNMDTENDGLEKVTPFKHCNSWYLC